MGWLLEHGPLVQSPPLPMWALRRLVRSQRVIRLYRDVYLAPRLDGRLPSAIELALMLAPDGYLTGRAALGLYGLDDQVASEIEVVSNNHRPSVRYRQQTICVVASPARIAQARSRRRLIGSTIGRVATPAQALFDCLDDAGQPLMPSEVIRAMRTLGVLEPGQLGRLDAMAVKRGSPSLARRVGYCLEAAGVEPSSRLRHLARSNHAYTSLGRIWSRVLDSSWRVITSTSKEAILAESAV